VRTKDYADTEQRFRSDRIDFNYSVSLSDCSPSLAGPFAP